MYEYLNSRSNIDKFEVFNKSIKKDFKFFDVQLFRFVLNIKLQISMVCSDDSNVRFRNMSLWLAKIG